MAYKNKQEKEINEIESEALRIANWINKDENVNVKAEQFIEYLLINLNLNFYEVLGILDESKNVLRELNIDNQE